MTLSDQRAIQLRGGGGAARSDAVRTRTTEKSYHSASGRPFGLSRRDVWLQVRDAYCFVIVAENALLLHPITPAPAKPSTVIDIDVLLLTVAVNDAAAG